VRDSPGEQADRFELLRVLQACVQFPAAQLARTVLLQNLGKRADERPEHCRRRDEYDFEHHQKMHHGLVVEAGARRSQRGCPERPRNAQHQHTRSCKRDASAEKQARGEHERRYDEADVGERGHLQNEQREMQIDECCSEREARRDARVAADQRRERN
jgi:hypothetical protein